MKEKQLDKQTLDFGARIFQALPKLSGREMQHWIEKSDELRKLLLGLSFVVVLADRSSQSAYPDWVREILHPELVVTGPEEFNLIKDITLWHHEGQIGNNLASGEAVYEHLRKDNMLKDCLSLSDGEAIQEKGGALFCEIFEDAALALWKSVVENHKGDRFVPFLYRRGSQVKMSWWKFTDLLASHNRTPLFISHKHIVDLDANPFVPDGWTVEEHIKGGQFEFNPKQVVLHLDEEQQDDNAAVGSEKLRKKLKDKSVYNANLLDFCLAHPNLIPEEWKGKLVFFWGTIYRSSDGDLCVRYLYWFDGGWHWDSRWLDYDFRDDSPAAVPASN